MRILFLITFSLILQFSSLQIRSSEPQAGKSRVLKVAILIYDGVYLLDFAGPLEIFKDAMMNDTAHCFEVFLVSESGVSVKAHTGTGIIPDYSIGNCPQPDILVIPGGDLGLGSRNKEIGEWIVNISSKTEITMSVCTGALILGSIGLLDGLEATTWYGALTRLEKLFPKIRIVRDRRYTDNGHIITTAGVSAGIDGALYIVEKYFGKEIADKTAKYIEYNRQ